MCSSVAISPEAITDIASSTMTGTFDITRTTGTPSGRCFSTNEVRTPAAKLITVSSGRDVLADLRQQASRCPAAWP